MKKILFLFLLVSTNIWATNFSGEIYTYGYFDFVVGSLTALSSLIAGGNDYLFKIVTAMAMFIFGIRQVTNPKAGAMLGFEFAKFLTTVTVVQQLFLTAPNNTTHAFAVVDRVTSQTQVVQQVPVGVGQMLSLTTRLEDAIMQKMDMAFSTPDSMSYRTSGMGFAINSMTQNMQQSVVDPMVAKSFAQYMENCKLLGDFSDGTQNISTLYSANSTDLPNILKTSQTLLTVEYSDANPNGAVVSCATASNDLITSVNLLSTNRLAMLSKQLGMIPSTYNIKSKDASTVMTGNGEEAQDQVVSAILRNGSIEALKSAASSAGMDPDQMVVAKSIADTTMGNDAALSMYEAQGTIPMLKAIVLAFTIALSWLLAILSIATLNMNYIKMIITLNVWLVLWGPLYTVLNYAVSMLAQDSGLYSGGIAISNQMTLYTMYAGKMSMMSKLVWGVPMLAFAIAKGSDMAMTSFIGAASSGIQQAVQRTSSTEAQQGYSGTAGNFHDIHSGITHKAGPGGLETNSTIAMPNGIAQQSVMAGNGKMQATTSQGADSVNVSGDAQGNIGVNVAGQGLSTQVMQTTSAKLGESQSNAYNSMLQAMKSMSTGEVKSIVDALNSGDSKTISSALNISEKEAATVAQEYTKTKNAGDSGSTTHTVNNSSKSSGGNDASSSQDTTHSTSTSDKIAIGAGIKGGVQQKGSDGSSSGVSVGGAGEHATVTQNQNSNKNGMSSNANISASVDNANGTKKEKTYSESDAEADKAVLAKIASKDKTFGTALASQISKTHGTSDSQTQNATKAYSESMSQAESYQRTLETASAFSASLSTDQMSRMFKSELQNNQMMKEKYLDDKGAFKDKDAAAEYSAYVLDKLESFKQGANGMEEFSQFAKENGGNKFNNVKDLSNVSVNPNKILNGESVSTENQTLKDLNGNSFMYSNGELHKMDTQAYKPSSSETLTDKDGNKYVNDNGNIHSLNKDTGSSSLKEGMEVKNQNGDSFIAGKNGELHKMDTQAYRPYAGQQFTNEQGHIVGIDKNGAVSDSPTQQFTALDNAIEAQKKEGQNFTEMYGNDSPMLNKSYVGGQDVLNSYNAVESSAHSKAGAIDTDLNSKKVRLNQISK